MLRRAVFAFGAFVFLFLYIFKPFGLNEAQGNVFLITLGYGFITGVVMSAMYFAVRPIFPKFYNEPNWNIGKEILNTMVIILLVALGNLIYSSMIGFFRITFEMLLVFLGFTAAVGFFPVLIQVLIRQNALHKRYASGSESINEDLAKKPWADDGRMVTLKDEDGKEVITCMADQLIALESADNYVKIYLSGNQAEKSIMVRNALGKFELELGDFGHFFRTHRTYLINLDKLEHVDGNARGYTIKLKGLSKQVPVARRRTDAFDQAIASR